MLQVYYSEIRSKSVTASPWGPYGAEGGWPQPADTQLLHFTGIAATTFYDQIKRFFDDCARVLRGKDDVKGAERFEKASTHWMRHSHASHAIASGMPIEIAQQNLGHASLATTTVYVTTEKRRRMKAVEVFWKR